MSCWSHLGIEPTHDKRVIKKAYAKLLKLNNPEDTPEGFQALREAYNQALELSEYLGEESAEANFSPPQNNVHTQSDVRHIKAHTPAPTIHKADAITFTQEYEHTGHASDINKGKDQEALTRANSVIQTLTNALYESEALAMAELSKACSDKYFEAFDAHHHLEGLCARFICNCRDTPLELCELMGEKFDWELSAQSVYEIKPRFHEQDPYSEDYFYAVKNYMLAKNRPYILEFYYGSLKKPADAIHVEQILCGSFDENALESISTNKKQTKYANKLFNYIVSEQYHSRGLSPIPPETEHWLLENNVINHKENTEGSGFNWYIILYAIIGIKVIMTLIGE